MDDGGGGGHEHEFQADTRHLLPIYWKQCNKGMLTQSMYKEKTQRTLFLYFYWGFRGKRTELKV
jgi:hypothetical protein